MAQYIYTMNRVAKVVPPKRFILRDISLSFFPGAKIGVLGLERLGQVDAAQDHGRRGHKSSKAKRGRSPASRSASCRRSPRSTPAKNVRGNVEEGVADLLGFDQPLQRDQRQIRRAARRRRDDEAARGARQAAGQDRRRGRLGARTQARHRGRRAAAAAVGRERQLAVGRRATPRRAVPAAAVEARHAAARRADEPSRRGVGRVARAFLGRVSRAPSSRSRTTATSSTTSRAGSSSSTAATASRGRATTRRGSSRRSSALKLEEKQEAARQRTIKTRARMGAHESRRAPREEQGAPRALRGADVEGIPGRATRRTRSTFRRARGSATS